LRVFSFGGYGLALAALAFMVFGAIECPPIKSSDKETFLSGEKPIQLHIFLGVAIDPKCN